MVELKRGEEKLEPVFVFLFGSGFSGGRACRDGFYAHPAELPHDRALGL